MERFVFSTKTKELHAWVIVSDKISFHKFKERPRNCMHEYWCLTRYPFRFTLSSNSLQVIFFHHLYEDFNYNNFFELPTQISARANTSKIWLFGIFQRKFKYWIFIHNILNIQFLSYLTKWVENWKWVFFLNFGSIENMVIWNNS